MKVIGRARRKNTGKNTGEKHRKTQGENTGGRFPVLENTGGNTGGRFPVLADFSDYSHCYTCQSAYLSD